MRSPSASTSSPLSPIATGSSGTAVGGTRYAGGSGIAGTSSIGAFDRLGDSFNS
jgi:hypothetical protein